MISKEETKHRLLNPDGWLLLVYMLCCISSVNAFASNSFIDNHDGTVTDSITGLMWQQGENGTNSWYAAGPFCAILPLAGYSDWRLPTLDELTTLIDTNYYPNINTHFFPNVAADAYWSSTPLEGSPGFAWDVYFNNGYVYYY
ncbi:MAG: DUF1566 domain-containing protein [Nitrospiraceae bacterium]|nr:DUF1566 domain-containing protein [Nitrospiraceae bacterium]